MTKLELWGGHECTVNRVGDGFLDQTKLSGHEHRLSDLDAFADLGLSALRYPLLWERIAPEAPDHSDWTWADRRMARLRELGIRTIAGLVHHGSGPRYVDLRSPDFAPGLAAHARAAAQRYEFVEDWTPVNEPLTTARFSALYGHWYPHKRSERLFWLALLNQIDATRLAMREIRAVNPHARLIQTEDLGKTYATDDLGYQMKFDNTRRWMTWDLLSGRVTPEHPLWRRLRKFGYEARLRTIADDPCPPDVIGINHYLTSDRFLDTRCGRYKHVHVGGNQRHMYVDIEATRVLDPGPAGLEVALQEAWERYGTKLAVTEVHNGCTRDEQVRWFADAWATARKLRSEGVRIEAVTAWSLIGAYDWDSLLTLRRGHYEPGVFDVSSGSPRPTALAWYLRRLGEDETAQPDIGGDGWWRRDIRFVHPPIEAALGSAPAYLRGASERGRPLLILGATGTLGQALGRACAYRDLEAKLTSRAEIPLCDAERLGEALQALKPRAVINATGWVRVDDAESAADECRRANTEGAVCVARVCADAGVPSVIFSSDLVFDGAETRPYLEGDPTNPLNVYGASKAEAEGAILALSAPALIVRTAAFFSPHDPYNFAAWVVRGLRGEGLIDCASDLVVSPTYTPGLANAVLDLVIDGEHGVWHVSNETAVSWADFAHMIAKAARLDGARVNPRSAAELEWPAKRPAYSALGSSNGRLLRGLDESVAAFAAAVAHSPRGIGLEDPPPSRQACVA